MKNIHVLPTDKPSRLRYNLSNILVLTKEAYRDYRKQVNQNTYITSDEEIKEGEWVYDKILNSVFKFELGEANDDYINENIKKIILTTDQDLIKDGVQAIDDEFLEWFVKNPSCEFVGIEKYSINCSCENQAKGGFGDNKIYENSTCHERNRCDINYKIIIPKEEPKQESVLKCELCKTYPRLEGTNKCESCYSAVRHVLELDPRFKDTLLPDLRNKQETLTNDTDSQSGVFENFEVIKTEEDAKIFVETMENIPEPNDKLKKAFKDFNKQETLENKFQSWNELLKEVGSEEELLEILELPHILPLVREAMKNNCKKIKYEK